MLEYLSNQGAGLQGFALQTAPRVMALASHGSQQDELPLLWELCSTLVGLGYSVAVLDGTSAESEKNHGLDHLLEDACWRPDGMDEPNSWVVLPAGLGLQRLCDSASHHASALEPLSQLFQNYGVVLIYARVGLMVPLLDGSDIEPLLAVSRQAMSPVTAYQALKEMVLKARLKPTIAAIMDEHPAAGASGSGDSAAKKLQDCAMTFLGYQAHAQPVGRQTASGPDQMFQLALRLLENAVALPRKHWAGVH